MSTSTRQGPSSLQARRQLSPHARPSSTRPTIDKPCFRGGTHPYVQRTEDVPVLLPPGPATCRRPRPLPSFDRPVRTDRPRGDIDSYSNVLHRFPRPTL